MLMIDAQVTPTDNNILSAAFPCDSDVKYGKGSVANPYYWH